MGKVTLVGIGSLMAKSSAENSFSVENFRKARLDGWERVFNLVGVTSLRAGRCNPERDELAVLAARPNKDASMLVSVFDIPEEHMPAFYEREERYRVQEVEFEEFGGGGKGKGIICLQNTTENYKKTVCKNSDEFYQNHIGQHWPGDLWYNWDGAPPPTNLNPRNILPIRKYLALCRAGAHDLDTQDDFLHTTYLFDGRSLRRYLEENPEIEKETRPGVPISFLLGKFASPEDAAKAAAQGG